MHYSTKFDKVNLMLKRLFLSVEILALCLIFMTSCAFSKIHIDFKWVWLDRVCFLIPTESDFLSGVSDEFISYSYGRTKVEVFVSEKEYFDSVSDIELPDEIKDRDSMQEAVKLSEENEKELFWSENDNGGIYTVNCGYYAVFVAYSGDSECAEITAESVTRNESLNSEFIKKASEKMSEIGSEKTEISKDKNIYGEAVLNISIKSDKHFIKDRMAEFFETVTLLSEESGLKASDIPSEFILLSSGEIKIKLSGAYSFKDSQYIFKCVIKDEEWKRQYEEMKAENDIKQYDL